MVCAVVSGKGGAGKTTVAASLAWIAPEALLLDCDVEEPNSAILLSPEIRTTETVPIRYPVIDAELCTACGACARFCRFNALISSPRLTLVQPQLCHDCGGCAVVCPAGAVGYTERELGTIASGLIARDDGSVDDGRISIRSGRLTAGEHSGVRIIRQLRTYGERYEGPVVIDAPPGAACATVAAVEDADLALIVIEPTPFGISDMGMVLAMLRELEVPAVAVVNKAGDQSAAALDYCRREGIPVLGTIPFRREIAELYARGGVLARDLPGYRPLFEGIAGAVAQRKVSGRNRQGLAHNSGGNTKPRRPKELVVISGKGGTGKTVITASLIPALPRPVIADCDVDAPNLHLLVDPVVRESAPFFGLERARIDAGRCSGCGRCGEVCNFGAVEASEEGESRTLSRIDPRRCEGCGICVEICPAGAVVMEEAEVGTIFSSETVYGPMLHARLIPGEETSGRLVAEVRRRAMEAAQAGEREFVVIDGSPGIGCNVISSLTGADAVLVVTEPTLSGLHDLRRVLDTARELTGSLFVIINRADISTEIARRIRGECRERGIEVLAEIAFDEVVARSVAEKRIPSLNGAAFFESDAWRRAVSTLRER